MVDYEVERGHIHRYSASCKQVGRHLAELVQLVTDCRTLARYRWSSGLDGY